MDVKAKVDKIIAENKIAVFSKSYCPYCRMAKQALNDVNAVYFTLEIENDPNCSQIQDYLLELTGGRTVPRVFIAGEFVGGGSELRSLKESGKLAVMVKNAGALR